MKKYFNKKNIGLFINIVGTFLIAIAISTLPYSDKNKNDTAMYATVTSTTKDGDILWEKKYPTVYFIHPVGFKIGIVLLGLGFFIQLKKE